MLFKKLYHWSLIVIATLLIAPFEAAQAQIPGGRYTGLFSEGSPNSFALELSSDGSQVVEIVSDALSCSFGDSHTFTINPGLPVTGGRFLARDVPVPVDPDPFDPHTLDIDGVFFDADGNGTPEQALGGLPLCPVRTAAISVGWQPKLRLIVTATAGAMSPSSG